MAIVQSSVDFQNTSTDKLAVVVTRFLKLLVTQFNGNVQFTQNIKSSSLLTAKFTAANTDLVITHDLGQLPVGYLVVGLSAAMVVYTGSVAWTSNTICLRSSVVGTATIYAI